MNRIRKTMLHIHDQVTQSAQFYRWLCSCVTELPHVLQQLDLMDTRDQ